MDAWGTPAAPSFVLAGRGVRLGAFMLNALLFAVPFVLASIVAPGRFEKAHKVLDPGTGTYVNSNHHATLVFSIVAFVGWLVVLVVNAILLGMRKQSVGKLIVGIEIVRSDGSPAGFWRLVGLRGFLGLVPWVVFWPLAMLGDAPFIFRRDRRCIHDLVAGTVVVVRQPAVSEAPIVMPMPSFLQPIAEVPRPVRRCTPCLVDNPGDSVYCSNCGNRLDPVPVGTGAGAPLVPDPVAQETFQW